MPLMSAVNFFFCVQGQRYYHSTGLLRYLVSCAAFDKTQSVLSVVA